LTAFTVKIFVSSSGRGVGIVASGHSGSALKGTEVSNFYG